jgi:hypothetical protein
VSPARTFNRTRAYCAIDALSARRTVLALSAPTTVRMMSAMEGVSALIEASDCSQFPDAARHFSQQDFEAERLDAPVAMSNHLCPMRTSYTHRVIR